jgi:translation initiation factor IF-3
VFDRFGQAEVLFPPGRDPESSAHRVPAKRGLDAAEHGRRGEVDHHVPALFFTVRVRAGRRAGPQGGCTILERDSRRAPRINERIGVREVRVVGDDGQQLGVLPTRDALAKARELGLDLVEVSPNSRPPVCRIMDFGKYKYEQSKKAKQSRKRQHQVVLKEIKLRPKIEKHDYEFKKKHIVEFLDHGDKVKITLQFRGREMAHADLGRKLLDQLTEELKDVAKVESAPRQEGRMMIMMLAPSGTRPKPPRRDEAEVDEEATVEAEE